MRWDVWSWTADIRMRNVFSAEKSEALLAFVMPRLINYLAIVTVGSGILLCFGQLARGVQLLCKDCLRGFEALVFGTAYVVCVSVAAAALLGVAVVPMSSMHRPIPTMLRTQLRAYGDAGEQIMQLHTTLQPMSVSSGYGLFRRMTGVDTSIGEHAQTGAATGWGGMPPSMVAVPVVILEATTNGQDWHEVPFRYLPGDPSLPPRRTGACGYNRPCMRASICS